MIFTKDSGTINKNSNNLNLSHLSHSLENDQIIGPYFSGFFSDGENFSFIFEANGNEITNQEIENFFTNYTNEDFDPSSYVILDYVSKEVAKKPVETIDYVVELNPASLENGALVPNRVFHFGELREVIWYADSAKTIPVIKVEIIYNRTSTGIALSRQTKRSWYKKDGSLSLLKVTNKTYNEIDMMDEMYTRRTNVVSDGIITAVYALSLIYPSMDPTEREDMGKEYIGERQLEIDKFIKSGTKDLLNSITQDTTTTWMNTTIAEFGGATLRETLMYKLDIWNNA